MPYGQSWPKFMTYAFAALISTFGGSQVVHDYYKPLADMDILIQKEVQRIKAEKGIVDDSLK